MSIRVRVPDPRWKFGCLARVQGEGGASPQWELRRDRGPGWGGRDVEGETPEVLDGKRVGVFGSMEKDFWDPRAQVGGQSAVAVGPCRG